MNKELEIWKFAVERLARDESIMLLIVAESSGSSPGRQGFKMIVAADEMCGSVGGGVMEVALVELASENLIKNGESGRAKGRSPRVSKGAEPYSFLTRQVHQKNSPDSSGMICSGKQTVIFFQLEFSHLEIVEKIIIALENQRFCRLQISNFRFQMFEEPPEGGTPNENFKFERTGESEFIYEEKLGFMNRLFIIGGGHCALALSELMSKMDFHISLFDDRGDLNTLAKNEFVHRKEIISSYENIGDFIEDGDNVYVVVMTLGYKFDEVVIRSLFYKDFKYFGVLGSKAKMNTLLRDLEKDGFDKEKLGKIHTPIGLPINSRTPDEIAVSIAAEIISVKNSGN